MTEKINREVKRMDIKEFRAKGFLQELNRQFLHPLGLAIEVIINDETGEESLGGVWDYRDDPEGLAFIDLSKDEHKEKADFVKASYEEKCEVRKENLGFEIQPVGHKFEE